MSATPIPKVSICLPSLNSLPFLKERCDTIFSQTFQDWDLLVFDSYSDDGSWEFLQQLARSEPRMRLQQGPREGPYPAWNRCVKETSGEYVYIATSDDTMASDCLEKMVNALEQHPECDVAHCPLRIIDTLGNPLKTPAWPEATVFAESLPDEIVHQPHLRKAPYDGLLHLTGRHVILSITQLLIRRSLFDRTGMFLSTWGSISDFNWEMKAGLVANVVHVPDTWASWRIHPNQLTASQSMQSPERDRKIEAMIQNALEKCGPLLPGSVLRHPWFQETKNLREFYSYLGHGRKIGERRLHQAKRVITGPGIVRQELLRQITGRMKWPQYAAEKIRRSLEQEGFTPIVGC